MPEEAQMSNVGPLRTLEWEGVLTAQSSIAHTGKEAGIRHAFRKESIILADGSLMQGVPILSGSAIRGGMRRIAAVMMQDALAGDERLPFDVVNAFRSGGSLRETRSSGEVLTGETQARLRDLLPMLAIFGFSTSGRIISGRLSVDKAIPVAAELSHLITTYRVDLGDYRPPATRRLLQGEDYTRFADVNDLPAQPFIEMDGEERVLPKGSGNMLWNQETMLAGSKLLHRVVLDEALPVEASFMRELMHKWTKAGKIGAQKSRGMGRFTADYTMTAVNLSGDEVTGDPEMSWRDYVAEHREEALALAVKWL